MVKQNKPLSTFEQTWDIMTDLMEAEHRTHVYTVGGVDEPTSMQQVERMIELEERVLTMPFNFWTAAQLSLMTNEVTAARANRDGGR